MALHYSTTNLSADNRYSIQMREPPQTENLVKYLDEDYPKTAQIIGLRIVRLWMELFDKTYLPITI